MNRMIQQFNNFRQQYATDPMRAKSEVERLVAEGKMSQAQLNQLQNYAMQFVQMLRQFGIKI